MFGFIKKTFIGLLSFCAMRIFDRSLVSNSKEPVKCTSLKNQPCQAISSIYCQC